MRHPRPTLFAALAAAGAVVLLAGCSGPGGGEKLDYEDSPLNQYFSAINESYDEDHWVEQQKEVEELVAACMSKEGFDYTPVDQSQGMVSFDDTDWEERQTEEWISQNGWGMVQTQAEMDAQQEETNEWVDPNGPYVESLSPSEQEAYWATLHGPGPSEDELNEDGSYEWNWETSGCYGAAQHEVEGEAGGNYWDDEEFKPLMDAMNAMWEKTQQSEEVRELDRKWAECMADAGYPGLKQRQDAQMDVNEQVNAVYEEMDWENPDYSPMDELKELEIETALADFRCAKDLDYENTQLKAQFAVEEQFVQDHKSELDALVAAYGKGK